MGRKNNKTYSKVVLDYFQQYLAALHSGVSDALDWWQDLQLGESFISLLNFCIDRN